MPITSRCAVCDYVDPQLQITVSAKIAFSDAYYGFMLKRHIWTIQKALTRGRTDRSSTKNSTNAVCQFAWTTSVATCCLFTV